MVKLDDEQLPYASRHYITTQRLIRIADDKRELTVACPDAPLWQVGGFTFGRFGDPDGRVERKPPTLLAWLTNNYWMTNFQADQGGEIRFRFSLLPSRRRLSASRCRARLPASIRSRRTSMPSAARCVRAASLLTPDLGPLLLTRLEADGSGVALTLLNPGDEPVEARIGGRDVKARQGQPHVALGRAAGKPACSNGEVRVSVAPRAWTRVAVYPVRRRGGPDDQDQDDLRLQPHAHRYRLHRLPGSGFRQHAEFIDQALDLIEATDDYPDEAHYRWTCEITGPS